MFYRLFQYIKDRLQGKPVMTEKGISRSSSWPKVRKEHLAKENRCQWCHGRLFLEVHHIVAFHVEPGKELKPDNLITLCERPFRNCHYKEGHNGTNWKYNNPNVREDCEHKWTSKNTEEKS